MLIGLNRQYESFCLLFQEHQACRWEGVRLPRASGKSLDLSDFPRTSPEAPLRLPWNFSLWISRAIHAEGSPEFSQKSPGSSLDDSQNVPLILLQRNCSEKGQGHTSMRVLWKLLSSCVPNIPKSKQGSRQVLLWEEALRGHAKANFVFFGGEKDQLDKFLGLSRERVGAKLFMCRLLVGEKRKHINSVQTRCIVKARLRKVHFSGDLLEVFDFLRIACSLGIPQENL